MKRFNRNNLPQYFHEAQKPDHSLGLEIENLLLDEEYRWVPFEVLHDIFSELVEDGWRPVLIDGELLGAEKGSWNLSLEPGSQLELSLLPVEKIKHIGREYKEFMYELLPRLHERELGLYSLGYQPLTPLENIKIIKKQRYAWMYEHFASLGGAGHHMMKATAATQVSLDFSSEEDFAQKLRLTGLLSPYLSVLFDNSALREGKPLKERLWRHTIWKKTDPMRSGILPGSLEEHFTYQGVIDDILGKDPILYSEHGVLKLSGGKTSGELFPQQMDIEEWEHLLSMFFYDVRVRTYLEVRMMDSLPLPLILSAVAMLKGLIYNKEALLDATELLLNDRKETPDVVKRVMEEGLRGRTKEILRQLIIYAGRSLEKEAKYLAGAVALVENEENLSDQLKRYYQTEGLDALKRREVKLEFL